MTSEVIHSASRTKGDIIGDDDIESMGSDASSVNSEGEQEELPHHPPEVVDEVFSSMIDSIPRTKEEIMDWCRAESFVYSHLYIVNYIQSIFVVIVITLSSLT